MRRGPAANGHQSQEDEGQQGSADDTYEVATSPQLARRFQSVRHDRDARSPHEHSRMLVRGPSRGSSRRAAVSARVKSGEISVRSAQVGPGLLNSRRALSLANTGGNDSDP